MNEIRDKASKFTIEVKNWVGNSPLKAAAFGAACAVVGWGSSFWPF